MNDQAT